MNSGSIAAGLVAAPMEGTRPGDIATMLLAGSSMTGPLRETTPSSIGPEIEAFAESLGLEQPRFLRVIPRDRAGVNGCHHAVNAAVAAGEGEAAYVTRFWITTSPTENLFITGEAHAVLRSTTGELTDITPTADGETVTCVAVDPRLGPGFDFLRRHANVHLRICKARDDGPRIRGAIECFNRKERARAEKRAAQSGLTLEGWIAARLPPDPLVAAVDGFLRATEAAEAMLVPTRRGLVCRDQHAFARATDRKLRLYRRMAEEAIRR